MSEPLFFTTDELFELAPQTWLVYHILPDDGHALLYGPPGEGKSFIALDWALCVASGQAWLGKYPVKGGHVLYIASEGIHGLPKRIAAWRQLHGYEPLEHALWYLESIDLLNKDEVDALIETLEERFPVDPYRDSITGQWVEPLNLKLVVVDTLARNFGGEDENAAGPMTRFIEHLHLFAKRQGALVLIVHHTNATGQRERGHTALGGAMDAMFECKATEANGLLDIITLTSRKQKDDKKELPIRLKPIRLELPELPADDQGNVQTSLALEEASLAETVQTDKAKTEAMLSQSQMLRLLAVSEHGYTGKEWWLASGMSKSAAYRRIARLQKHELVERDTYGRYTVVSEPDEVEE